MLDTKKISDIMLDHRLRIDQPDFEDQASRVLTDALLTDIGSMDVFLETATDQNWEEILLEATVAFAIVSKTEDQVKINQSAQNFGAFMLDQILNAANIYMEKHGDNMLTDAFSYIADMESEDTRHEH